MFQYEAYHFGENNMIWRFHNINFTFPRNLHRSLEIVYVKDGNMQVTINNKAYMLKKDQAMIILPYETHSFLSTGYSDSYTCVFSHEFVTAFDNMISGKALTNPVLDITSESNIFLLKKIFDENSSKLELKGALYLFCAEFLSNSSLTDISKMDYELLHKVLNYVQENYTNNISLKEIAKDLNYSYTYLSKYINNFLGISFADFINEHRISYAISLLNNTDLSITDISFKCGYSNVRSFNRNFIKLVHKTPTEYKNNKTN